MSFHKAGRRDSLIWHRLKHHVIKSNEAAIDRIVDSHVLDGDKATQAGLRCNFLPCRFSNPAIIYIHRDLSALAAIVVCPSKRLIYSARIENSMQIVRLTYASQAEIECLAAKVSNSCIKSLTFDLGDEGHEF